MSHITTCPGCGRAYEESSGEASNSPDRMCSACWTARAREYQQRVPAQPKHTPGTCRSCGREIVWMKTKNGKNIPVNAETWEPGDELFEPGRHVAHFADCPNADQHRRPA